LYELSVDKKYISLEFWKDIFDCIWLEGHTTFVWVKNNLPVTKFGKIYDKFSLFTSLPMIVGVTSLL